MPRGVASLKKSLSYSLYQDLYASESPVKSVQPLQRLHTQQTDSQIKIVKNVILVYV